MSTLQTLSGRVARLASVPPVLSVRPPCASGHTLLPQPRAGCTVHLQLTSITNQWHRRCSIVARAALLDDMTAEDNPQDDKPQEPSTPFGLPLPEVRHQRPLDYKSIKLLRTQCNTAARNKELMNIQAGQHGITQTFLSACMDILSKRQFVRVRLGEGCGLERQETAEALEKLLDCVCVHQIGYTISLYRELSLPRPSNCPSNANPAPAEAQGEGIEAGASDQAGRSPAVSGKRPMDKRKKIRPPVPKQDAGPAEFQVVK